MKKPRLLQDQYPTRYLPHVGRQVMESGGAVKKCACMLESTKGLPLPKPPSRQHGGRPKT
jgi:hypothetical protein